MSARRDAAIRRKKTESGVSLRPKTKAVEPKLDGGEPAATAKATKKKEE